MDGKNISNIKQKKEEVNVYINFTQGRLRSYHWQVRALYNKKRSNSSRKHTTLTCTYWTTEQKLIQLQEINEVTALTEDFYTPVLERRRKPVRTQWNSTIQLINQKQLRSLGNAIPDDQNMFMQVEYTPKKNKMQTLNTTLKFYKNKNYTQSALRSEWNQTRNQ